MPTWPNRHYIACRQSPQPHFRNTAAKLTGTPGWSVGEIAAAHDVPMTHPGLVADLIANIAKKWGLTTG